MKTYHKNISIFLFVMVFFPSLLLGQDAENYYTLKRVIEIAKKQSPEALSAQHRFRSSYWQYRTYLAAYRPQLKMSLTIPNYSKSISSIQQDDGSFSFRSSNYTRWSGGLSLSQKIGPTGGEVFVNSNIDRMDLYDNPTLTSYMTTPVNIGFSQPLFSYNSYKWEKRIEPLKYKEAKQKYLEEMEQVSITAINYFFNVLQAQIRYDIDKVNLANNDTLYKIAQGRYNIGTIAENELLQMELRYLNSKSSLRESELELNNRVFYLKSYLRLPEWEEIKLIPPINVLNIEVDPRKAKEEALKNRSDILSFDRKLLEAQSSVSRAKSDGRFSASLYAVYGLTQSAEDIEDAYKEPSEQQQVMVGISIPIIDWGLAKGKIKMAESQQELVKTSVEQERIDFNQEVYLKVMKFNIQNSQLHIASKSDTVAQKRYEVTKQRYIIGKIGITELNIAQTEKDNSKMGYVAALHNFWQQYYQVRKLTLFDFKDNREIFVDPEYLLE